MTTRDFRTEPFKKMVVLGESAVQGGPWLSADELRWADILANLIDACQDQPLEYLNEGIGASVISPKSAGYADSNKPSAMERYKSRVIDPAPDLFVMAYGLNDMRCATDPTLFAAEMETIVRDVKASCDPLILLVNIYYMTGFDRYPPFDQGSCESAEAYNRAIASVAAKNECLIADVWWAMNGADWLVHGDGVHANAVGNMITAHKVFEVIAANCSCLSERTNRLHRDSEWTRVASSMAYTQVEPLNQPDPCEAES